MYSFTVVLSKYCTIICFINIMNTGLSLVLRVIPGTATFSLSTSATTVPLPTLCKCQDTVCTCWIVQANIICSVARNEYSITPTVFDWANNVYRLPILYVWIGPQIDLVLHEPI